MRDGSLRRTAPLRATVSVPSPPGGTPSRRRPPACAGTTACSAPPAPAPPPARRGAARRPCARRARRACARRSRSRPAPIASPRSSSSSAGPSMSTCAHGPVAGEVLEEGGGGDRIAVRPPRGVAQVGDPGLEQAPVARVQRPRPREVADRVAGVDDRVAPGLVVGEHAAVEVAHPRPHRARQRREVDDVRRALAPRVPERVGQDQPALGVRVRHLDGQPRGGRDDVRRPDRVAARSCSRRRGGRRSR